MVCRRLAFALLLAAVSFPAEADYGRGLDAYTRADYAEAVRQLTPAAEAGDPEAELMLGRLYAWGLGVPQDLGLATQWFDRAIAHGEPDARIDREEVERIMPPQQRVELRPPPSMTQPAPDQQEERIVLLAPRSGQVAELPAELPVATPSPAADRPYRLEPEGGLDGIRRVQRDINRGGYHAGPVDGIVGRLTRQGIRAYERDHGWPVTGRIGPRLRQALEQGG
jgi:hypothetical protein